MFEERRGTVEKQVMIRCKSIQRDERGKAEEVVLETPGVYGEDEDSFRYGGNDDDDPHV